MLLLSGRVDPKFAEGDQRSTEKEDAMKIIMKVATLMAAVAMSIAASAQQRYSASEQWTVGSGDYILDDGVPGCGQQSFNVVAEAAQAIAAAQQGGVYGSLGSVLESVVKYERPEIAGTAGHVLDMIFGGGRFANCVPVSVVIPAGAQITSVSLQAGDGTGTAECTAGQDCPIGWSRFDGYQILHAGQEQVITSQFRNWSGDRTRTATMIVYFTY